MRVPVYERQSGIAALPAVQSPVLAPESDGGAAVAGAVKNLADRAFKIHNDWEDSRTLELFSKFKADSADFHDNPNTGILNTRTGYLSEGVFHDADQWMRKRGEDYARQLQSPRAKNNFRRMATDFITQQGHTNSRFEAAQMKKYRTDTADAAIKNYLADIEAHWDDTEFIQKAREAINQALELKHRGEGQEVFFNAGLEVDDQIAQARIRQAYVRDPLRAVQLLQDKDIKLKPETRAKLTEALRNKTEIYELRAIAEEYAKNFTPENSADAERKLTQTYGAEKGQKAFQALSHIWSVQNYQDSALRQRKAREQDDADEAIRWRFLRRDDSLTEDEVRNSRNISSTTAYAVINGLRARKAEAARLEAEQKKLQTKKTELELEIASWSNIYPSDESLQDFADNGVDREFLHTLRNRREEFYKKQNQSRLDDTYDRLKRKIINPDKYGRLDIIEIQSELDNGNLETDNADTLKKAVEARNKAEQAQSVKNDEEARKHFQTSLRIIAENGGIIRREQVNTLLRNGRIDDAFANYLYGKEDEYNREQEKLRKENEREAASAKKAADKAQAEQDKLQLKEKLYAQARQFARAYPTGHSGEGRLFIQGLNIPVDDKNQLLQYYDSIIQSQRQEGKDSSDEAKRSREEIFNIMLAEVMNGRGLSKDEYLQRYTNGDLTKNEYDALIAEIDKREKAAAKVQEDSLKDSALRNADSIFNQFGLDNHDNTYSDRLDKAYDTIRAIPDRNLQLQTRRFFEDRLSDKNRVRNEENRIKADTQRQNLRNIDNTYWRNFKTVPIQELDNLRSTEGLTEEQYQRALTINDRLGRREGVIDAILRDNPDFNNWTLARQEAEIMSRMGTSEDDRKQNVANILALLQDGKLTDAQIDFDFYHGKISSDDRENIKNFDKRFDKMQKSAVHATEAKLLQFIHNLGVIKDELRQELVRNARVDFMLATNNLDVRDKDFNARLQDVYDTLVQNISTVYAEKVSLDGWFSRSPAGIRYDAARARADDFSVPQPQVSMPFQNASGDWSYIDTTGNSYIPQPFTPTTTQHDPYYQSVPTEPVRVPALDVSTQSVQLQTSGSGNQLPQSKGIVDFTKGILENVAYRITDGYYSARKAYRQGRSHFAIDLAAPEGTTVKLPGNGLQWTLAAGKSKAAGNFITASTTTHNGDNLQLTFGHLSSADVNNGDILSSGDIIGKSGSTGNVTGPHLHIAAKLNGIPVDPRSIDLGNPDQNVTQTAPPVVSSDAERRDTLNAILFGNLDSFDIFAPSGSFGVN